MFCDLVITGLAGIRPQEGNRLTVNPLIPADAWDYFCLVNIPYHGHTLAIFWDRDGKRYNRGAGFHILIDGKEKMKMDGLSEKPAVIILD
jgi:hypothetical protein